MIFTSLSQCFVRWHQLIHYYHDFSSAFVFCIFISLFFLFISFHRTIIYLWANEHDREVFKERIQDSWNQLNALPRILLSKAQSSVHSLPTSISRDKLSIKMNENIVAIKEMVSYVVGDFNYESVPVTFKRKVDDIFTKVSSHINWSLDSFPQSLIQATCTDDEKSATKLYCSKNGLNLQLCLAIRSVGDYFPPWWYNAHLGTIISFGSDPRLQYFSEQVEVKSKTIASTSSSASTSNFLSLSRSTDSLNSIDSKLESSNTTHFIETDSFNLDWYPRKPAKPEHPDEKINIVMFVPGLGLSSKNAFAQKFARYMHDSGGYYTVICGARGLDVPLRSDSFWHPAKSDDVVFVVNYISNLFGNSARIFLVGYSAGSNIVQKALLHCRRQEEECAGRNDGTRLLSPRIWGATCVCITYDYMAARQRLERSPVGAVYSMLMAHIYKSIIHKNAQVHHLVEELESPVDDASRREDKRDSSSEVDTPLQTTASPLTPQRNQKQNPSDSASKSNATTSSPSGGGGRVLVKSLLEKAIFLSDYDELCGRHLHKFSSQEQLQEALSMLQCRHINVPMLAIQPLDDPLHAGRVRENVNVAEITSNPNIIFMETQFGNHFGFYEGSLSEAFSSEGTYTYPAKVAKAFFDCIVTAREARDSCE